MLFQKYFLFIVLLDFNMNFINLVSEENPDFSLLPRKNWRGRSNRQTQGIRGLVVTLTASEGTPERAFPFFLR